MTLRPLSRGDVPALQDLLTGIALFPPEMLPDIAAPALDEVPGHLMFVCDTEDHPVGFVYLRAEEMAEGVWNMLALGVDAKAHRSGYGSRLVAHAEAVLADQVARLLIVDTSDTEGFAAARAFYASQGYEAVARIPDYWAPGDAKVTFSKALATA